MRTGKNMEGYTDPTASCAIGEVSKIEMEVDKRVHILMKVLKYIINTSGFELMDRIHLKDIKSGREFK